MKNVNQIYLIDFTFWVIVHIIINKRYFICILPHNIFSSMRCRHASWFTSSAFPKAELFFPMILVPEYGNSMKDKRRDLNRRMFHPEVF